MNSLLKKIFGTLTEKPWEASQAAIDTQHSGQTFNLSNQMSAVIIIFGISTVLFSLIFTGYLYSLPPGQDTTLILKTNLLWINTLVLIAVTFFFDKIRREFKIIQDNGDDIKMEMDNYTNTKDVLGIDGDMNIKVDEAVNGDNIDMDCIIDLRNDFKEFQNITNKIIKTINHVRK